MPSELEKMIERYKSELMRYKAAESGARSDAWAGPESPPTAPMSEPSEAPNVAPMSEPVEAPDVAPMSEPIEAPDVAPMSEPIEVPGGAPVSEPIEAPDVAPMSEPIEAPGGAPVSEPIEAPGSAPVSEPVEAPYSDTPVEMPQTTPVPPQSVTSQIESARSDDEGYLQVRVSTADFALPVELALVTVTGGKGELIAVMLSNEDGLTRTIALPTAPRSESNDPQFNDPFDTYTIEIKRKGYADFRSEKVPVFGGVTNTQEAELIPLPEFADEGSVTVQNTEPF